MTRVDQLRELVKVHCYREETVSGWSDDRIRTVLAARRRDARLGKLRADSAARAIDGLALGQPSRVERFAAAAYLEEAMGRGGFECVQAVLYCGHVLTDDEAKALAAELIATLRAVRDEPDAAA
jgi:hypothetical protein